MQFAKIFVSLQRIWIIMRFSTEIANPRTPIIDYNSRILFIGSCFAERIAEEMNSLNFGIMLNPSGISYNPASMADTLCRIASNLPYSPNSLEEHDGRWFSPDHHGAFDADSPENAFAKIEKKFDSAKNFWNKTSHIVITFGSSVVWERNGKIYNNCHKLPQREFSKRRLNVSEIVESYDKVASLIGNRRVILTVSPVRYLEGDAIDNSANKATLILAADELCRKHPNWCYFPAYEILMDELRDYRFYADDFIHPSPMAVKIIFDRFRHSFLSDEALALAERIEKLHKMHEHRPLHPESPEWNKFKQKIYDEENCINDLLAGFGLPAFGRSEQ